MLYAHIGSMEDRDVRKHAVRQLYETLRPLGYSYADLARETGLTRNQIAGDIRDSRTASLKVTLRDPYIPATHLIATKKPLLTHVAPPQVQFDAAVYDIEVSSFTTEGYNGFLACACFLDVRTGELFTVQQKFGEGADDRRLMNEVFELMAQYRILIGHNVASFDYPWLLSRSIFHRGAPPPFHHYIDTYQLVLHLPLKTRKGLGNLVDYLRLDGTKTAVNETSWSGVRSTNAEEFEESMSDIVYHCQQDVLINQQVLDTIYPYAVSQRRASGSIIRDAKFVGYMEWPA
jgi:hypothetical protein